jgi:TP901 family phage tail tape measure protein
MAERESSFRIAFNGDDSDIAAVLARLKGKVQSATTELERTTGKVELFKNTEAQAAAAAKKFDDLSARAAEFRQQIAQIEGSGGKVGKELTEALKLTEKQIAATSKEYNRQADALKRLSGQLEKAGVDTSRLAAEEKRLAAEIVKATKAQAEQQARLTLGVKSAKDTAAEIAKLNAAYATLRNSGASVTELAQAHRALVQRTSELAREQGGLAQSFATARAGALATAAAIGGVVAAVNAAVAAAREYEIATARIGTVANLTEEQLGELGQGVRDLSQTLGFDLQEGLKAVYDLLRAGVPAGNVLEVLATADDAAKAGVASLGEAAKLSGVLIRGFGLDAQELKPTLDALFVSMQNGGATFGELAQGLGELAPIAKATGTPIEEVAAAIQVMTKAGLDAPGAIGQLTQIMTRLSSADTVKGLKDLGIESRGLVGTLQQISERGLGLDEILQLGVSSKRAAAGVAALTNDSTALARAMEQIGGSAGALDKASDSLNRLNAEAVERLTASLKNLVTTLGQIATPSTATINSLANLVQVVDRLARAARDAQGSTSGIGRATDLLSRTVGQLTNPLSLVPVALQAVSDAATKVTKDLFDTGQQVAATAQTVGDAETAIAQAAAAQAEASRVRLAALRAELSALIPELESAGKAIQSASSAAIQAINQQAATQAAGLDKLRQSEADNATALVAIQKKAADDRLAILQKASAEAIKAADAEALARTSAAGRTAEEVTKAEAQVAKSKQAALTGIVQQYEAHVATLIGIETSHLNKIAELNKQRITVNETIEERIRELRRTNLSDYDQYYDKVRQIDENISKARRAFAEGDFKAAEEYAKKAVELTAGIASKVEKNGETIVSQFRAQETAVSKLKLAQEVLNDVIDERVKAEEAGAKATQQNLESSRVQLENLRKELDAVNAIIAKGISITIETDTASVTKAKAEIDSLQGRDTSSTHTVTVKTVEANAAGGIVGEKLAALTRAWPTARRTVQHFANGGGVFRRPGWSKVPGVGNGDTVPAALQAGSFVVKKAASRYYGDGMMRSLAARGVQRFALGGPVGSLPALGGKSGPITLGAGGSGRQVPGLDYQKILRQLTTIVEAARGLPRSSTGLDIGLWASAILNKLPYLKDEKVKIVADMLEESFEGFLSGIQTARDWRVPSVVSQQLLGYLFLRRGGQAPERGTDTVPAMLTPGEFVVNRSRVDQLGAGFLHAVNSMRFSRESLAAMLRGPAAPERPRYYADGGQVTAGAGGGVAVAPMASGAAAITVNLNASAEDIFSQENVRRFLVPVLRDIDRRSSR